MSNTFMHGAYSELGASAISSGKEVGTTLCALVTAPVHLIRREKRDGQVLSFKESKLVDYPILFSDSTAKNTIGCSTDWQTYTVGEVLKTAFENSGGNVAPVFVMNVFDPDEHSEGTSSTKPLEFVNNKCSFLSDSIILDTLALTKTVGEVTTNLVENTDYKVSYDMETNKVIIKGTDNDNPLPSEGVVASFTEVNMDFMEIESDVTDMIKGTLSDDGTTTGLKALRKMFAEQNKVTNILIAPGFTHINAIYNAMVSAMQGINGKFYGVVYADIPTSEIASQNDTITKASAWKAANGRNAENACSGYPCGYDSEGNIYHYSTVKAMKQLEIDQTHDSIPYESTDNKSVPMIIGMCMADGTKINAYEETTEANVLNAAGIGTFNKWSGSMYLWGNATDAYTYDTDYDLRARFDVNMRMLYHLMNRFILNHHKDIGKPMTLSMKEDIEREEQEYLDMLVKEGALIGEPKFAYIATKNANGDIVEGNFRWDLSATPTPPLNSVKVVVSYTDSGFKVYTE